MATLTGKKPVSTEERRKLVYMAIESALAASEENGVTSTDQLYTGCEHKSGIVLITVSCPDDLARTISTVLATVVKALLADAGYLCSSDEDQSEGEGVTTNLEKQ